MAFGVLLGIEALGSSPAVSRRPRAAHAARMGYGVLACAAIVWCNLPPRGAVGIVLLAAALGWGVQAGRRFLRPPAPPRPSRGRRIALLLLALLCVGWGGASLAAARYLVARRAPPGVEPPISIRGAVVENLRLRTTDGVELGAWWIEGTAGETTVVVLHGNKSRRSRYQAYARFLAERGHSVLVPSLRAHGDSGGQVNDYGWGARHDLIAAVDEARRRRPADGVVVLGRSLGAAAALYAAEELGESVDAYFLEAPFRDLRTATRDRIDRSMPGPIAWFAVESLQAAADLWMPGPDHHQPGDCLTSIPSGVQVLLLFGRTDRQAPRERFDELVHRRPATEVHSLDLGGHRPMLPRDPRGYAAIWDGWRAGS